MIHRISLNVSMSLCRLCIIVLFAGFGCEDLFACTNKQMELLSILHDFDFDEEKLKDKLSLAPLRDFGIESEVWVELPDASGKVKKYWVYETSVFATEIGRRYQHLRSYYLEGKERSGDRGRLHLTEDGIYGLILGGDGTLNYVEPKDERYVVYRPKEDLSYTGFDCITLEDERASEWMDMGLEDNLRINGCSFKRYRLAVSATGEYSAWHGGTVSQVLGKLMVLVGNANLVFEEQLGVSFELVNENDALIFLDGETDPFSANKFAMLQENQDACNEYIGASNYDLGIVVAIVGGGAAQTGSVCNSFKAMTVAGSTWSPEGYPLESTFLHELGHKFGATHSFNNYCSGNRSNLTAYETGSGSSLMSYAGACSPSVTYPRDYYFHLGNLNQMRNYIQFGLDNDCGQLLDINMAMPLAQGGVDIHVPIGTPFELDGDYVIESLEGQQLRFQWEQMDREIAIAPPSEYSPQGPTFRSFPQSIDSKRMFPREECLLDTYSSVDCEWEVVPDIARDLSMRLGVFQSIQGYGCWDTDDVTVSLIDSGNGFELTYPNGGETFLSSTEVLVQWNIGLTTEGPIFCEQVELWLSVDGGFSFSLLDEVENIGSASVVLPSIDSDVCRMKIRCSDQAFLDITDGPFSMVSQDSTIGLYLEDSIFHSCQSLGEDLVFELTFFADDDFEGEIQFPVSDNPNVAINPLILSSGGTAEVTVSAASFGYGTHYIELIGYSNNQIVTTSLTLVLSEDILEAPILIVPMNNATKITRYPYLSCIELEEATHYEWNLSINPSFENPNFQNFTEDPEWQITEKLQSNQIYYWRVRANNSCGSGQWSEIHAFQTANQQCTEYHALDMPKEIVADDYDDAFARIEVLDEYEISGFEVSSLKVDHSLIGDLSGRVISPEGTSVPLFYRPGISDSTPNGCLNNNIEVSFSDNAILGYDSFHNSCNSFPENAIVGDFVPMESFEQIFGEQVKGQWLLNINDLNPFQGGILQNVSLNICRDIAPLPSALWLNTENLLIDELENKVISVDNIEVQPQANITFRIVKPPIVGKLYLEEEYELGTAGIFTLNQLEQNQLSYQHTEAGLFADYLIIEAYLDNGIWSGIKTLHINIEPEEYTPPSAQAFLVQNLNCYGEISGIIEVEVQGGVPPYTYQLNDGEFQDQSTFDNLPVGIYQITVFDIQGQSIQTNSISINQPDPIDFSFDIQENNLFIVAEGGTGNLSYNLGILEEFQSQPIFENIENGTYTLTIRDDNDCAVQTSVQITYVNATIDLIENIQCFGGQNASVELVPLAGKPPFFYSVNGGEYQVSSIFENLGAGEYNFSMIDDDGLLVELFPFVIEQPSQLQAIANVSGTLVTVEIIDPIFENYEYSFNQGPFVNNNTFNLSPNQNTFIVVRDPNNCTVILEVDPEFQAPVISSYLLIDILCNGEESGQIYTNIQQGMPPYRVFLNNEEQLETTISNLSSGLYNLFVLDQNNLSTDTIQVEIIQPLPILIAANSIQDSLTIQANGGVAPYTYSLNNFTFQQDSLFTQLQNGDYTLYVKDSHACISTFEYTHHSNELSISQPLIQTQQDSCGQITVLSIQVCLQGGTQPYQTNILPSADSQVGLSTDICANSILIEYLEPRFDSITIELIDQNNQQFTTQFGIPQSLSPLQIDFEINQDEITILGTNGQAPYLYSLDGLQYQNNPTFTNLSPGDYTLYIRDELGCIKTTNAQIIINNHIPIALPKKPIISPNPSFQEATISNLLKKETLINIYNASGFIIYSLQTYKMQSINLPNLPIGLYFVEIQNEYENHKLKWIKR